MKARRARTVVEIEGFSAGERERRGGKKLTGVDESYYGNYHSGEIY
jgi:hypothetical protein